MTPYYEAPDVELHCGNCLDVLPLLPSESVQMICTSPPYWGQRRYSGGAAEIGSEPTPDAYVAALVAVFEQMWRVLRSDGTVWLNLGDCWAGGGTGTQGNTGQRAARSHTQKRLLRKDQAPGIKPKDLLLMPARVALALQAAGWWLRSEIIWSKPNPLPESVLDRPTRAHEQVYLLSKQPRYYYDHAAIREPLSEGSAERYAYAFGGARNERLAAMDRTGAGVRTRPIGMREPTDGRNKRSVWTINTEGFDGGEHYAVMPSALVKPCILAGSRPGDTVLDPFSGAGTTALVARQLGRKAIAIELNPSYCDLAVQRITGQTPALPLSAEESA